MKRRTPPTAEKALSDLRPRTALDGRHGPPRTLAERLRDTRTPGAGIAVVDDFALAWARGFGRREAGKPGRVTPATLFQASSISKTVFALAVMRLVKEGRLDLERDVNDTLRSWQVPPNDGWQPRVTLRRLLNHTAGLTVNSFPGYLRREPLPDTRRILDGRPPAANEPVRVDILPGLQCRYSGGGTLVAQQLVTDLLGRPFPEIMASLVLAPLGMQDSTYLQPLTAPWLDRAAAGHPWKGVPLPGGHHVYPEMAAAGLWTTPADLARAGLEMVNALNDRPARLLDRGTAESLVSPQLPGADGGDYIGLEFFCGGSGDGFHFGCPGWNEGFLAVMRFYPRSGQGAVVMLNANGGLPLLDEILAALGRAYRWPGEGTPTAGPTDPRVAEEAPGGYETASGMEFRVVRQGGGLALLAPGQPPLPLIPLKDRSYRAAAANTVVVFETGDGGVAALTVHQAGQALRAVRKV